MEFTSQLNKLVLRELPELLRKQKIIIHDINTYFYQFRWSVLHMIDDNSLHKSLVTKTRIILKNCKILCVESELKSFLSIAFSNELTMRTHEGLLT